MQEPSRPGVCGPLSAPRYRRQEPERTVLHQVVREHLETFLARQQDLGRPVPRTCNGSAMR